MIFSMPMNLKSAVFLGVLSICSGALSLSLLFFNITFLIEWEFCFLNGYPLVMAPILDWISTLFSCFVFFISSMIVFYWGEHMSDDSNIDRYMYTWFHHLYHQWL